MAKVRYLKTKFWTDTYISELDPTEKLLYLYLITNEYVNLCGIYELPIKMMSVQTGIEAGMITKIIERFISDKKIAYFEGWVAVFKFPQNQDLTNPKIKRGLELAMNQVPEHIRIELNKLYPIDKLSIGYQYPMDNINTNSNTNTKKGLKGKQQTKFIKPTVEEIKNYCKAIDFNLNENQFFDYYESKGWLVGRSPMKNWKAAIRTWKQNETIKQTTQKSDTSYENFNPR